MSTSTSGRLVRNSRNVSPFVPGSKKAILGSANKSADTSETAKNSLGWVEPPVAPPRPSYEEAKIEKHGIVQNMQALGSLPSAKLLKSLAKNEGEGGFQRSSSTRRYPASSASTARESLATPEPQPPQSSRSPSTKIEELVVTPLPRTPTPQSSPTKSVSRQSLPPPPPRSSEPEQAVSTMQPSPIPPSPIPISLPIHSTPVAPHQSTPPVQEAPRLSFMDHFELPDPPDRELCDQVVTRAVQEALDRYRYPTAYALRTLYDDHKNNLRIVRLIESIYNETATHDQRVEFNSLMRHKKRQGKKNRTAEYYFNGDGSDTILSRGIVAAITAINPPAPRPYTSPYAASLPPRPGSGAGAASETQARSSSVTHQSSASISASTFATPQKDEADHEHISKKLKPNDFQPVKTEVNQSIETQSDKPEPELESESESEPKAVETQNEEPGVNGDTNAVEIEMDDINANNLDNSSNNTNNNNNMEESEQNSHSPLPESPAPANRGGRSRSASSSSSLSSINEQIIEGAFASANNSPATKKAEAPKAVIPAIALGSIGSFFTKTVAQDTWVSPYANPDTFRNLAVAAKNSAVAPTTVAKKPGPRIHTFAVTPTTSSFLSSFPAATLSSSTNNPADANNPPSTNPSMAPALLQPSSSKLSSVPSQHKFRISKTKNTPFVDDDLVNENDQNARLKRKAREKVKSYPQGEESFERHRVQAPEKQYQFDEQTSVDVAPSNRPFKKINLRITNKNSGRETRHGSSRTNNYDSEDANLSSPTALGFHPHLAPGSTPSSRAVTPNVVGRGAGKKGKPGSLRVKISPMKKRGATSAGIPRSGERNKSPVGNGVSSAAPDANDSDDFCSACGGAGELVCCDGEKCTRSFHWTCCDPPLVKEDVPDDQPWYCDGCKPRERPIDDYPETCFQELLFELDKICPQSFSLPLGIREYFENVKTGTEGEYEEVQQAKPKNPKGWEEAPDYFRLKDNKGNAILCYSCHGLAQFPDRSIISCTYCGLNWHMDCLPVPLAREPAPGRQWRCPAHVDDLLAQSLGPAHRFRKIKGAPVIKPAFSCGMRNNGHIEIEYEASVDEPEQEFFEQKEYGHVYRLPERGIKLDFITKIKQQPGWRRDFPAPASQPQASFKPWEQHSLEEQQAAMNLASMIPQADQTNALIEQLIAQAPPAVVTMIAQGSTEMIKSKKKFTDKERLSLEAAVAFIQAQLAADQSTPADTPAPSQEGSATKKSATRKAKSSSAPSAREVEVPLPRKARRSAHAARRRMVVISDDDDDDDDEDVDMYDS